MKKCLFLILFAPLSVFSQNFDNGYEFFMPPFDSSGQKYLPSFPAAPMTEFISVDTDGHFYAGNRRIRFWGGNNVSGACFPEKDLTPGITDRMRKVGINIIRFHHMDNPWSGQSGVIFDRSTGGTRHFHPDQLDKFHFLLSHMKRNGIYANLNLLVSREFQTADGIPDAADLWAGGRVVNMFDPEMIELQKEYARNLLTGVNAYTGLALKDDPVVAMVEIANENSIYGYWKNSDLTTQDNGGILLPRHDQMLDELWNTFLQEKYPDQSDLEHSWNEDTGGGGINQVSDGNFESGNIDTEWNMELHSSAEATITAVEENPYEGDFCGKVEVTRATDVNWHTQFRQIGFDLKQGKSYRLKFAARADQNRVVTAYVQQNFDPWHWYNGSNFNVTDQWQEFEIDVAPFEDNTGRVRLGFMFDADVGTFWFDNISLSETGLEGIRPGELLSAANIQRIRYRDLKQYSENRTKDLTEFYIKLQKDYFDEMYRFLKEDLGVKVPVSGTNALTGVADLYTNSDLDYIDDHGYWDHPWWPNGWSLNNWYIRNTSMLENWRLGQISDLFEGLAIEGKPLTISEFRIPFPNRRETEMIPLLTSYGAFHDTDGIMFFQYNESNWNWESDKIADWWSMHRNPALMSMMPIFGKVFRDGLIAPADRKLTLKYPQDYIRKMSRFDNSGRWSTFSPYDDRLNLGNAVRVSDFNSSEPLNLNELPEESDAEVVPTSTFETKFDAENNFVTTVTPKFVSITGKLNNPLQVSADILQITGANNWGTVAWLSLTEEPLTTSRRSLLTLTSEVQNSNMNWTGPDNVDNEFGNAPTLMYPLATSLLLEIEADSVQLFPLSPTGKEGRFVTHYPIAPKTFLIGIDQAETETPWYGIEAFGDAVSSAEEAPIEKIGVSVFPNPTSEKVTVLGNQVRPGNLTLEISDVSGTLLQSEIFENEPAGVFQKTVRFVELTPGVYFLKIKSPDKTLIRKIIKE